MTSVVVVENLVAPNIRSWHIVLGEPRPREEFVDCFLDVVQQCGVCDDLALLQDL
jgi:hypothetical protein